MYKLKHENFYILSESDALFIKKKLGCTTEEQMKAFFDDPYVAKNSPLIKELHERKRCIPFPWRVLSREQATILPRLKEILKEILKEQKRKENAVNYFETIQRAPLTKEQMEQYYEENLEDILYEKIKSLDKKLSKKELERIILDKEFVVSEEIKEINEKVRLFNTIFSLRGRYYLILWTDNYNNEYRCLTEPYEYEYFQ